MAAPGAGLRAYNRERILAAVRDGATSRAELGARTGLARSTVASLVAELQSEGRLAESSTRREGRGPGRPTRRLRVAAPPRVVLAMDMGHSHVQVALLEVGGAGHELGHDEAPRVSVLGRTTELLDVDAAPRSTIERAEAMARSLMAARPERAPVAGALGLPAPVDQVSGAVGAGSLFERWVERRPAVELAERLGLPFTLDNDANLGALAEATFGSAQGVADLVYVKAATGIGAGLLLGGRIHHGRDGRAGEIGHVPVETHGALCRCGNRGCLETLVSVPHVLAAFGGRADAPSDLSRVAALVRAGDDGALRVIGDAGRLIGRALADLVNALNPEQVVLGGQLAATGPPLLEGVRESIDRHAQPGLARHLRVGLSALGDSAELLGAAVLAAALVEG